MAAHPCGVHADLDDDGRRPLPLVIPLPTHAVALRVADIVAETGKSASAGRPMRGRRARLIAGSVARRSPWLSGRWR